jgi:hypothetical protein
MGFFSWLFGDPREQFHSEVERSYFDCLILEGYPHAEAVHQVREAIEFARKEATLPSPFGAPEKYWSPQHEKPAGVYGAAWHPGSFTALTLYGQSLLSRELTDSSVKAYLETIRSEGVRDEDVTWFWDMDSVDRIMMMHLFTITVGALFLALIQQTGTSEQAAFNVRKCQPCFGNPNDFPGSPDRLLPVELKKRIETYSGFRRQNDNLHFLREMERSTTFNALLRKETRLGRI